MPNPPLPGLHVRLLGLMEACLPDPVYAGQLAKEIGVSRTMVGRYFRRLTHRGLIAPIAEEDLDPDLPAGCRFFSLTPTGRIFVGLDLVNDFAYTTDSGQRVLLTRHVVEVLGSLHRHPGLRTQQEILSTAQVGASTLAHILMRLRERGITRSEREPGHYGSTLVWGLTDEGTRLASQCCTPGIPVTVFSH